MVGDLRGAVRDLYRSRWGEPDRYTSFSRDGCDVGVGKWQAEGVSIYATIGGSDLFVDPQHRTEFFCGLHPERDEVASPLAALAMYGLDNGVVIGHGDTVPAGVPIWPGSGMSRFLIMRPQGDFLDPADLPGGVHVVFMQAVPIYEAEAVHKTEIGADAFIEEWERHRLEFWNPDRPADL